jgi:hypothetical protein
MTATHMLQLERMQYRCLKIALRLMHSLRDIIMLNSPKKFVSWKSMRILVNLNKILWKFIQILLIFTNSHEFSNHKFFLVNFTWLFLWVLHSWSDATGYWLFSTAEVEVFNIKSLSISFRLFWLKYIPFNENWQCCYLLDLSWIWILQRFRN